MNIETLQIVIIAALSICTVFAVIIGTQIILLLKEIRIITKRINHLSLGLTNITALAERSLKEVGTLTEGAKLVSSIVAKFINRKNKNNDNQ